MFVPYNKMGIKYTAFENRNIAFDFLEHDVVSPIFKPFFYFIKFFFV